MRPDDTDKWARLVYDLLYPAILGSMLYDICSWTAITPVARACGFVIAALYTVDYIHLYLDLRSGAKQQKPLAIVLDAGAAVILRVAFAAALAGALRATSLLLFLVFVIFIGYYYGKVPVVTKVFLVVYPTILGINALVAWAWPAYSMACLLSAIALVLFIYTIYVFSVYHRYAETLDGGQV